MSAASFRIFYVGGGDNARGPLAAACTTHITDADGHGVSWEVSSAGVEAVEGGWVRPEAVRAAREVDLDISAHTPTPLTVEACQDPDLILAMSWDQVSHIWSFVPQAWDKVFTVKEFVYWAKRAPSRPPILFPDRGEQMRDRISQAHTIRKRARADHGFWGGIRPQDLNLIDPAGKGEDAWATLAHAVKALVSDVIVLLTGPEREEAAPAGRSRRPARSGSRIQPKAKAKARR